MGEKQRYSGSQIIRTLDKGLLLLETIEKAGEPVGLQRLTELLGWEKSTVLRLANTLENRGLIRRDPTVRGYTLGAGIFRLYQSLTRNLDLQRIARPFLTRVFRETGETTHLSIVRNALVVFIDKLTSDKLLSANIHIGGTEPLHCTSVGKAYLAFLPEEEAAALLPGDLPAMTVHTLTGTEELRKELERVRNRGFAVDDEEYIEGVRCVGIPILSDLGLPVGMIGVSAPSFRMTPERAEETGAFMKEISTEVSRLFGYSG